MKIAVILASTRDGRLGEQVAQWVYKQAQTQADWEVELVDIKSFNLPLFEGSTLPSMLGGVYDDPTVTEWSNKIREMDAFIFVTPEYNHSLPAPLKNAIDCLYPEWANKAAAIVSYSSGRGGGIRAAEHLRAVLSHVAVANVQSQITIAKADTVISKSGQTNDEALEKLALGQRIQLNNWATQLKSLRQSFNKN